MDETQILPKGRMNLKPGSTHAFDREKSRPWGEAPALPAEPKIETQGLSAYFGPAKVLNEIKMTIPANRVVAIIGPSGCGKSTFIRCLNRMHELIPGARTEGAVTLDGKNIYSPETDLVDLRRRIGMVFQRPAPFPTLSIYDNVVVGLKLTGFKKKEALNEIVESTLKSVVLWDEVKGRLHRSALALSGGQQQRLCIARVLAVNPKILLMDEPASALDPLSTIKIEELIHELKRNYTIVIVTHNMQQAARVSDYTGYFYLGTLVEFGETKKIFTTPEDYITGRFG